MTINENDVVELDDGRVVTVTCVFKEHVAYGCIDDSMYASLVASGYIDDAPDDTSETDTSEYEEPFLVVKHGQIKRVVWTRESN